MTLSPVHTGNPIHINAPYRVTDGTDSTPANAIFVARNPRMTELPGWTTNPHNVFDFSTTKYFREHALFQTRDVLVNDRGQGSTYTINDTHSERKALKWPMNLGKFERLLDDAVAGVKLARGREVEETVFADGHKTIALLDSIKATELLVQTVREGQLTTKVIDQADLDPALAKIFHKLKV